MVILNRQAHTHTYKCTHAHTHAHAKKYTHTHSVAFILLFISGTQSSATAVQNTFLKVVDDAAEYASDSVQQLYEIFCQLLFGGGVASAIVGEFKGETFASLTLSGA